MLGWEEAGVVLLLNDHKRDARPHAHGRKGLLQGSPFVVEQRGELIMGDAIAVVDEALGRHPSLVHPLLCELHHGVHKGRLRHDLLPVVEPQHSPCVLAGMRVHGADHRRNRGVEVAGAGSWVSHVHPHDHAGRIHPGQGRLFRPLQLIVDPAGDGGIDASQLGIDLHGHVGGVLRADDGPPVLVGVAVEVEVGGNDTLRGDPKEVVAGTLHVVVEGCRLVREDDKDELAGVAVVAGRKLRRLGHHGIDGAPPVVLVVLWQHVVVAVQGMAFQPTVDQHLRLRFDEQLDGGVRHVSVGPRPYKHHRP
mmetsp:Transcript_30614/g.86586  ORF Transcript_30614/g.86586 Transcript_30614/m.86586 type:complete len:307 (+) Transcript_30614:571-1491(+)